MFNHPITLRAGFIAAILGSSGPLSAAEKAPAGPAAATAKSLPATDVLRQALNEYPAALNHSLSFDKDLTPAGRHMAACALLEAKLKQPAGTLAREFPAVAAATLAMNNSLPLDRASALLIKQNYADAEVTAFAVKKAIPEKLTSAAALTLASLETAGIAACGQSIYTRALQHFGDAAAVTDPSRDLVEWQRLQHALAGVFVLSENGKQAEQVLRKVVQQYELSKGKDHAETLGCRKNVAVLLLRLNRLADAEAEYRALQADRQRILGEDDPLTLATRTDIANVLLDQGKHAAAEEEFRSVLAARVRVLGPDHPGTLSSRSDLGAALHAQKKDAAAEKEYTAVVDARKRLLGAEDPETLNARYNLASVRFALGRQEEAIIEFRDVLTIRERILGKENKLTMEERANLATMLQRTGHFEEAAREFQKQLTVNEQLLGANHPGTVSTRYNLATALYGAGGYDEATDLFTSVLESREQDPGPAHPATILTRAKLALTIEAVGNISAEKKDLAVAVPLWLRAYSLYKETSEAADKALPKNDPIVAEYRNMVKRIEEKLVKNAGKK